MESRDFAYWLQGFFELAEPETINAKQTYLIKRHLNLVFLHEIDPSHSDDPKVQGALQAVHDGVDVNELRSKLADIEAGPQAVDGPGTIDTLEPLSQERLDALEKELKSTAALAQKAFNRPTPRDPNRRYQC